MLMLYGVLLNKFLQRDAMTKITFRLVQESDLAPMLDLFCDLHEEDAPATTKQIKSVWMEILTNKSIHHYLAETEGILVASCHLVVVPNLTRGGRPYGVIENVVTKKEFRRQGIGTRLLRHVLREAWELDCYKVMLMTGSKRKAVHQFYKKAGFKPGLKMAFVAKPLES